MKNIKGIILIICILIITSCSEDFLERIDKNNPSETVVFDNTENAYFALSGLHRALYDMDKFPSTLQNVEFFELGGHPSFMIQMDLLGEDMVFSTDFTSFFFQKYYDWTSHRDPGHGLLEHHWLESYYKINIANKIIEAIDGAKGPQADKDNIKGQALTIRAFLYFHLVQLFSERYEAGGTNNQLGAILYIKSVEIAQGRATVADTYNQINQDLDAAMSLLFNAPERPNKSHLNLSVAQGLKARVALVQEDWQTAITMSTAAMELYTLMSNTEYQSGFNTYNAEWMWGWNMEPERFQSNVFASFFNTMSYNFNSSQVQNNPRLIFSPLYDFLPITDVRASIFDPYGLDPNQLPNPILFQTFPYHSTKFVAETPAGGDVSGDIPVMRAAEMYLIKAEAEQRNGDNSAAAVTLFALNSNRDANYTLSTNTGLDLLNEIWMYRRAELWGEGFRFKDLKRNNLPLNRNGGNHKSIVATVMNVPAGDVRWTFKIPNEEIRLNSIQQND